MVKIPAIFDTTHTTIYTLLSDELCMLISEDKSE